MPYDVSSLGDPRKVLDDLDRADAEESLRRFIELSWPVLEPDREFVPSWHIDAVCEHLEAVTNGQLIRLLINVPPGCMKSLTTNVFWPAWEWGPRNRPSMRYVGASYSDSLTIRDNRRCRNVIRSPWYQRLWGNRFRVVEDQDAKKRFDTSKSGFKIATSTGGLGTGERGDRFIIDDPHNIKDGESDLRRQATLLWFTEVVPTRVNDPESSAIIVIMQRVHERDVSGEIISKELGYEHLMLPMEFEPERKCITSIGFQDPRTEDGELLWPDRMTAAVVERDKKVLGTYAVAGQFQQRPSPRGGGMFQRNWFEIIPTAPKASKRVRAWDFAATKKEGAAFTVGCLMSRSEDGDFIIEDVIRFRGSPNDVERQIRLCASQDGTAVTIDFPQDPGQAGVFQTKYLKKQFAGFDIRSSTESGSKELRATPLSAQAEAGNVKLVRGLWNEQFLAEAEVFPQSEFKDQIDAASRAFARLVNQTSPIVIAAGPEEIPIHG